jgi:hypothetical protein
MPTHATYYWGVLNVSTTYQYFQIVLRAHGVIRGAPPPGPPLAVYPNPFNLTTSIRYTLSELGAARIVVYDVLGREARRFDLEGQAAGEHSLQFNAEGLASGVYFVALHAEGRVQMQKMLLVK